jgi:hypothetical protein
MLRTAPRLATVFLLGLLAVSSHGQQPQAPKTLEESGTVQGVIDGKIQFETAKSETWLIQLGGETKLHVEGTAELSYLRGGLAVRFTGEFDKKGALKDDIKEIEIFTPQGKNGLGLFADASADKPVRNAAPGSYEIRAKVVSFKDNEIVVSAGNKKISGKVPDDAAIKVSVEDVKDVKSGDKAKVKATYFDPQKPYLMNPGSALGEVVEVTLANPLTGAKKKAPAKVTKSAKEKKEKKPAGETAEDGQTSVQDLFGVDKAKDDAAMDEKGGDEKPKAGKKTTKKPAKPDADD